MSALDFDRIARNKSGSYPSTSLTPSHISDALLLSPDNGATLDLTKKGLTDVGETGAEELANIGKEEAEDECPVERIALGSNRLATLPTAFALLSRLRYLNLKNNSFSVFPDILTVMPSLDTLDISHNKIKRLPSQPGSLVNLRVFCFSRNKIGKIPSYLCKFRHLNLLMLDRNPIEWPPKSVTEPSASISTAQAMKNWIRDVQKWMEHNQDKGIESSRLHDDSGFSEQQHFESNLEDSYNSWSRFPIHESEFDAGVTPHARSFSLDSDFSISSITESLQELETPVSSFLPPERPPPLHLGIAQPYGLSISPSRSPESYLPSPQDSISSVDEHLIATSSNIQQPSPIHARNASYAGGGRAPPRTDILGKKSMPDLRTAKLNFSKRAPDPPLPTGSNSGISRAVDDFSIPSPLSNRADSGSSSGSNYHVNKPATREPTQLSPSRPVPSMDFERNSYFRRLSALPITFISNILPEALVSLIDSARSILFALCQVYQSLEHFTMHTIDDRLASVLRKVLDPATVDMMQLIDSLDRFDALSRKKVPPPAVCRSVVESCRDTVAVFGKVAGVLMLQLKVMASNDLRYQRQVLLVVYGAAAEVSYAWQAMLPHVESIKARLHAKPLSATPLAAARAPAIDSFEPHSVSKSLPIPEALPPPAFPMLRTHSANALGSEGGMLSAGRTRTARRHAGSFSSKDVEIGKTLPSYDEVPNMHGGVIPGVATRTPTLRTPKRPLTSNGHVPPLSLAPISFSPSSKSAPPPASSSSISSDAGRTPQQPWASNHSRQGSQTSLQTSSPSSSPSIPAKTNFLELPPNSKTQVDKEALHAVQEAVEVAPAVWDMMEETLGDVLETSVEVRESLGQAKEVTKRLASIIRAMQEGDPTADRKVLREDAHVFLKTVVQLSNIVKKHGRGQAVSPTLRSNMVKLTNSTEEFAILLHVSSFSPSSSSHRAYSPMLSASGQSGFLGSSLSRSRSAQASASKLAIPSMPDAPRSALPSQSFEIPTIRRLRVRENESPG